MTHGGVGDTVFTNLNSGKVHTERDPPVTKLVQTEEEPVRKLTTEHASHFQRIGVKLVVNLVPGIFKGQTRGIRSPARVVIT